MSDYDHSQINKKTKEDEHQDDKNIFFRNLQLQKLFEDYFFDRDKNQLLKNSIPRGSAEFNNYDMNNVGNSDKTTKFTTLATSAKNS